MSQYIRVHPPSIDRREIVFGTTLGHDFRSKVRPVEAPALAPTREKTTWWMSLISIDESREFRNVEDITFKEEEIVLNSFEIGFCNRRGLV